MNHINVTQEGPANKLSEGHFRWHTAEIYLQSMYHNIHIISQLTKGMKLNSTERSNILGIRIQFEKFIISNGSL